MKVGSHDDSANEFCCVGSIFNKLLGFVSNTIKLSLTELIGQCRNILPLSFSAFTSLRSVNTEKAAGNIYYLLTGCEVCTVKYKARGLPYSPSLRGLHVETKGFVFYNTDRAYPVNK